jgi:hypothetical protein
LRRSVVVVDAVVHTAHFFSFFVAEQFIWRFLRQRRRVIRAQRTVPRYAVLVRRAFGVQFVAAVWHTVARPIDFERRPVIIWRSDFDARRLVAVER